MMTTRITMILAILLAGCVPTEFDDLRGRASTFALAPPSDYGPRGFGEVVTAYAGTRDGTFGSRVAASAGAGSSFNAYPVLIGDEVRLDTPIVQGCDDDAPCMAGAGVSLVGLPRWGTRALCVAAAAPESGEIRIRCEDDITRIDIASGPGGQRFGESAVGLPEHPFARALFGAPGSFGGRGSVYRLPDGAPPVEVDLSEGFGGGGQLGSAIAAGVVDEDSVLIAASAPDGAIKRVIVARSDIAGSTVTTRVHGCIDATTPGWGLALAIGDLNGDARPEVAIGSGQEPGRLEAVRVYDGAAMPAGGTCDASAWPVAVELSCPELDGIDCTPGSFGAALAAGDVDGDGVGDLIVGMPLADVDDVGGAGAVFVFRGASSLTDLDATVAVLTPSSPATGAGLGTSVAAAPGAIANEASGVRRAEPVAGAPGIDRAYVFLCSGLDGDSPDTTESDQCQP